MSWATIMTGLGAVVTLTLAFNTIVGLGQAVDTLCALTGIICVMLFLGLVDDTGGRDKQLLEFDRE
jgi:hypothetical protein